MSYFDRLVKEMKEPQVDDKFISQLDSKGMLNSKLFSALQLARIKEELRRAYERRGEKPKADPLSPIERYGIGRSSGLEDAGL